MCLKILFLLKFLEVVLIYVKSVVFGYVKDCNMCIEDKNYV